MPKDQLTGFRGHLHLSSCIITGDSERPGEHRSYTASLTDGKPPPYPGAAHMHLNGVTLTRLDARGLVLTGKETSDYASRYEVFPQAWFCVPVVEPK